MNEKQRNELVRWSIILFTMLYFSIFCLAIYAFRYKILDYINGKFYNNYFLQELTEEQKMADFETFYINIVESAPYLENVKELYRVDFKGRKEYYEEKVRSTENNFQFYCTMKAISEEVVSFHTDVCFPLYSNLRSLNCYDADNVLTELGVKSKIDAWTDAIEQGIKQYDEVQMFTVEYVDGKYVVDRVSKLTNSYEDMVGCELLSINDISAQKYGLEMLSMYAIQYDTISQQSYRVAYTFNDSVGQKVKTIWRDGNEKLQEKWLYFDIGVEAANNFGYLFDEKYSRHTASEPVLITNRDDVNRLEYIKLNNFSNQEGKKILDYITNSPYQKIVIDLRDNYGGSMKYAQKYLYPALYSDDNFFDFEWKTPISEGNQCVLRDFGTLAKYYKGKDEKYFYYEMKKNYKGKQSEKKEIYYLMGNRTGSAADTYLAMVKEKNLGTIVGNNSGGEGLAESFVCTKMENSSLVYVFYPSIPISNDDSNRTEPDIYINQTVEDYEQYQNYRIEGTALEYENRCQYDTVLKWIIRQKDKE